MPVQVWQVCTVNPGPPVIRFSLQSYKKSQGMMCAACISFFKSRSPAYPAILRVMHACQHNLLWYFQPPSHASYYLILRLLMKYIVYTSSTTISAIYCLYQTDANILAVLAMCVHCWVLVLLIQCFFCWRCLFSARHMQHQRTCGLLLLYAIVADRVL